MFSGFSSYLGFNPQGSESVQALLQKPDFTLDELLDDETLLTELKTLNPDLLDFLKRDDNFTKVISRVVFEPSASEQQLNPQRCFRLPLVCADVLSADCPPLMEYLLNCNADTVSEDGDTCDQSSSPLSHAREQQDKLAQENNQDSKYIDYLFSFLDNKELNYTAAGYFAKILFSLLEKYPADLLTYVYKRRPEQLDKLANHISSESLSDLLYKFVTFEGIAMGDFVDETYNAKRVQILKLLTQKLDAQQNPEVANSAAGLLSELLGKAPSIHKGDAVFSEVLESETIEGLYKILKNKDAVSVSAVSVVLGSVFNHYVSSDTTKEEEENKTFDVKKEEVQLKSDLPIVAVTVNNVQDIVGILADALEGDVAFGSFRMKVVELVCAFMQANNSDINSKVVESELFKILLKLTLKFEWHSMLHNKVEKLLLSVILGKHEDLKVSLFENAKVIDVIMEAFKNSEIPVANSKLDKRIRKGYLGQLVNIANKILESHDPAIVKYTSNNDAWEDFAMTELHAVNCKNNKQLGGINPKIERYGSFEIQNPAVLFSSKPALNLDYEDQQNDQEGSHDDFRMRGEEFKGFKMHVDNQDDIEPTFAIKKAHFKFSQAGQASGHDEDQEIVEEVIDMCLSPPLKMKSFKFEDVIDESIEEDIDTDQNGDDSCKLRIKL